MPTHYQETMPSWKIFHIPA